VAFIQQVLQVEYNK